MLQKQFRNHKERKRQTINLSSLNQASIKQHEMKRNNQEVDEILKCIHLHNVSLSEMVQSKQKIQNTKRQMHGKRKIIDQNNKNKLSGYTSYSKKKWMDDSKKQINKTTKSSFINKKDIFSTLKNLLKDESSFNHSTNSLQSEPRQTYNKTISPSNNQTIDYSRDHILRSLNESWSSTSKQRKFNSYQQKDDYYSLEKQKVKYKQLRKNQLKIIKKNKSMKINQQNYMSQTQKQALLQNKIKKSLLCEEQVQKNSFLERKKNSKFIKRIYQMKNQRRQQSFSELKIESKKAQRNPRITQHIQQQKESKQIQSDTVLIQFNTFDKNHLSQFVQEGDYLQKKYIESNKYSFQQKQLKINHHRKPELLSRELTPWNIKSTDYF